MQLALASQSFQPLNRFHGDITGWTKLDFSPVNRLVRTILMTSASVLAPKVLMSSPLEGIRGS